MSSKAIAIIAGVGQGTGASIARKFAQSYAVALLARNPANYEPVVKDINARGGKAIGISTDVSSTNSVQDAIKQVGTAFPGTPLAAAVYNVGGGLAKKPFLELKEEEFRAGYESNALGAFNFSQATLPLLLNALASNPAYPPTLIFTGATASIKGSATFSSFASGKFALRALSQSVAREFGPQGVHVAHVIVDGVIDIERTKGWVFEKEDAKLSPDSIADTYWYLHTQPRTTFTHELDVRPYVEKW